MTPQPKDMEEELANKILWLGYAYAEEGIEKRKEAVSKANKLIESYSQSKLKEACKAQRKICGGECLVGRTTKPIVMYNAPEPDLTKL